MLSAENYMYLLVPLNQRIRWVGEKKYFVAYETVPDAKAAHFTNDMKIRVR